MALHWAAGAYVLTEQDFRKALDSEPLWELEAALGRAKKIRYSRRKVRVRCMRPAASTFNCQLETLREIPAMNTISTE